MNQTAVKKICDFVDKDHDVDERYIGPMYCMLKRTKNSLKFDKIAISRNSNWSCICWYQYT